MKQKRFVKRMFKLLADNKKFPSYQAERRIDIFINFFLKDILKVYLPDSKIKFVAPEFPLKKLDKNGNLIRDNLSTKLDYLYIRKINNTVEILFIELKTDAKSYDSEQHKKYLEYNWEKAIEGLKQIIVKTEKMPFDDCLKYYHLVKALYSKKLISFPKPKEFKELDLLKNEKGEWNKRLFTQTFFKAMSECNTNDYNVSVYYIGPKGIEDKFKPIELKERTVSIEELKEKLFSFEEIIKLNIETKYCNIWRIMRKSLLKEI